MRARAGSFLDRCYNPVARRRGHPAAHRRFGFDAAIIFSDILSSPDRNRPSLSGAGVGKRAEQGLAQKLIATTAIEVLYKGVLDRLAGRDVVPATRLSSAQRRIAFEVSSVLVVAHDHPRLASRRDQPVELACNQNSNNLLFRDLLRFIVRSSKGRTPVHRALGQGQRHHPKLLTARAHSLERFSWQPQG